MSLFRALILVALAALALPVNGYLRLAMAEPAPTEFMVEATVPEAGLVLRAIDAGLPKGMLRLYSCMPDITLPVVLADAAPQMRSGHFAPAAPRVAEEWRATPPHGPPRLI